MTGAAERLLPEARALLAKEHRIRQVADDIAAGTEGILRLGTSQGLGDRLEFILRDLAPRLTVRLSAIPLAERLAALRSGRLDAAFVRALDSAPGLELLPVWNDPLVVALPAEHPLAAKPIIALEDLAEIPLRLAPRADNPPLHDLLMRACRDAGFEPMPGTPFTNLQDTMAEIGTGVASWTVLYRAAAHLVSYRRVAVRPLARPSVVTSLAVIPDPPGPALRLLLDVLTGDIS
ncbi:hypothetical protein GCM10029978_064100 [Actinoallomurus acanthiterrae]